MRSPTVRALALLLALSTVTSAASLLPATPSAAVTDLRGAFDAALAPCLDGTCRAGAAAGVAEALAARFASLPTGRAGVAGVTAVVLEARGLTVAAAPLASADLSAAILRFYDVAGVPVDAALRAAVSSQVAGMDPAWRAALLPLVDALAASTLASRDILAPEDRALLLSNPALTSMLVSLVGTAPGAYVTDEMRALHAEHEAALARVDLAAAARAGSLLASAVASFEAPRVASAGCVPVLSLPFIHVGGACDASDTYTGTLFLQIDQGGDDVYLNNAGGGAAVSAIALDLGVGDDVYRAMATAQGAGLAAAGILFDEGGRDWYNASQFSQGSGNFGFGLLYDAGDGDDVYESPSGPVVANLDATRGSLGDKASAVGGFGILVDEGGRDLYQLDGLDGFVYGGAQGFGVMVDRGDGADSYTSREVPVTLLGSDLGVFAGPIQVSAEADGWAILYEEGGDDRYFMGPRVRQGGQGAAGVGALTLLLERGGQDVYEMGVTIVSPQLGLFPLAMGQGASYGVAVPPGPALALLHDVSGDDRYIAEKWAQGYGTATLGFLVDEAGEDAYVTAAPLVGARVDGGVWLDGALGVGLDRGGHADRGGA